MGIIQTTKKVCIISFLLYLVYYMCNSISCEEMIK
nr:MAG TPA: hypothetical protein [Bacteriophage sp.]DAY36396.1 MAG TPA: hypothetical protein [Bacteriophage sp.]